MQLPLSPFLFSGERLPVVGDCEEVVEGPLRALNQLLANRGRLTDRGCSRIKKERDTGADHGLRVAKTPPKKRKKRKKKRKKEKEKG